MPPARVDLGFLHDLPDLERLEMSAGVIHAGPGPSPLEPPFDGLPRSSTWLRIEAHDPDSVWQTYGSLADAFREDDFELEHHAYTAARARLQEVNRERADRIELDQADGTGFRAMTRDDLAWALETLGLA